MTLSSAATIVLARAADRPDRLIEFHRKLPTAARHKMIDAMLRGGIMAETKGDYRHGDGVLLIENAATGFMLTTLFLTDAGLRAIGRELPTLTEEDAEPSHGLALEQGAAETTAAGAPTAPHAATDDSVAQAAGPVADALDAATVAPMAANVPARTKAALRDAARVVLEVWDDDANRADIVDALEAPMATLRALFAGPAPRTTTDAPRTPREGTKQQAVLTLLRRGEGATIAQVMEITGWASHTVRGFFAGLKKKGIDVQVKERVKQAAPGTQGAKGSHSIYQVVG